MEEGIRRALARGACAERDLKRAVHVSRVGLWIWETAITNLIKAGEVLTDTRTTVGGHQQRFYWLAPDRTVTSLGTTPSVTGKPAYV